MRPGASLRNNYSSTDTGRSLVGLHYFMSRPARMPCRPMGVSSIIVVIAAGDVVRGVLYLFAGGAGPSRHVV